MKWISVKDEMPEIMVSIIICGDGDKVEVGYYSGKGQWPWVIADPGWYEECPECGAEIEVPFCDDGWRKNTVTHWMPLPDPPEAEVEGEVNG